MTNMLKLAEKAKILNKENVVDTNVFFYYVVTNKIAIHNGEIP